MVLLKPPQQRCGADNVANCSQLDEENLGCEFLIMNTIVTPFVYAMDAIFLVWNTWYISPEPATIDLK